MGIKNLNKFLKENAKESIKIISLKELHGKKIAVDISIYMYKYETDNNLIENIYLMLSIFRHYGIIPVFIFDGKPPKEKKELLQKRRENKHEAEEEYNKLNILLQTNTNIDENEKQEILYNMDMLKKKFVQINKTHIADVKTLIRSHGLSYYDAHGEADVLCASLVIKGKVWACLSEDMDMFVYGCPIVIRYLSLLNHTVVIYNLKDILNNLGITQKELSEICVLSGTDYNISSNSIDNNTRNLYKTLKYFKKYHKNRNNLDFYDWLMKNSNYIINYDLLKKNYNIFNLDNHLNNLQIFDNICVTNGPILKHEIQNILKKDGFIF
jgi:flap endonuclease-1